MGHANNGHVTASCSTNVYRMLIDYRCSWERSIISARGLINFLGSAVTVQAIGFPRGQVNCAQKRRGERQREKETGREAPCGGGKYRLLAKRVLQINPHTRTRARRSIFCETRAIIMSVHRGALHSGSRHPSCV